MKQDKKDIYYIAYDKSGKEIKHHSIDDVPAEQRDEAFMDLMYRQDGNDEFAKRLSAYRRQKAMG